MKDSLQIAIYLNSALTYTHKSKVGAVVFLVN